MPFDAVAKRSLNVKTGNSAVKAEDETAMSWYARTSAGSMIIGVQTKRIMMVSIYNRNFCPSAKPEGHNARFSGS